MKRLLRSLLGLAVVLVLCTASLSAPATAQGDRHAQPADYAWLGPKVPVNTYSIAVVRGLAPGAALRATGEVRQRLGRLTPQQAANYVLANYDASDLAIPAVVQVQRLGGAVVVYQPYGFRPEFRLARLSKNGVAASFSTLRRGRKDAKVAKRGDVVRAFSVLRTPPRRNALPEERGLDFGKPGQNPFATGWALNERLTLTHVSRRWFNSKHPTFVVEGPAY